MQNSSIEQHLQSTFNKKEEDEQPQMLLPFEAAQSLINAVKQVASQQDRYWDINQLAEYLGVSTATVKRHFISDPRWPQPIKYGNPSQPGKRWLASECRKALLLFRKD